MVFIFILVLLFFELSVFLHVLQILILILLEILTLFLLAMAMSVVPAFWAISSDSEFDHNLDMVSTPALACLRRVLFLEWPLPITNQSKLFLLIIASIDEDTCSISPEPSTSIRIPLSR